MYDPILLTEAMAGKALNWYRLGKRAGIDPKTAKKFVTTGKGNPATVRAVADVLDLDIEDMVKRRKKAS